MLFKQALKSRLSERFRPSFHIAGRAYQSLLLLRHVQTNLAAETELSILTQQL